MANNSNSNPSPPSPGSFAYPYSLNFQSSTSVAIIIVVLGATFFFMFLFVIYIKRCSVDQHSDSPTNGDGSWGRQQQQQQQMIHGLDPETLKKFPIMRFSSLSKSSTAIKSPSPLAECAVCLGTFEDNELLRLLPACNHLFHPDCIDMWLQSHSTCPLCRRSLSRDAVSANLQRALAAIAAPFRNSPPASPAHQPDLESEPSQIHILRALSRNSESFKLAAHTVEVQDVRDRLRSGSSARFASPQQQRVMTPVACGVMHHSHSFTELSHGHGNGDGNGLAFPRYDGPSRRPVATEGFNGGGLSVCITARHLQPPTSSFFREGDLCLCK